MGSRARGNPLLEALPNVTPLLLPPADINPFGSSLSRSSALKNDSSSCVAKDLPTDRSNNSPISQCLSMTTVSDSPKAANKMTVKSGDDDFDIESYYARLHAIPRAFSNSTVETPIPVEESTFSEIDLNSSTQGQNDFSEESAAGQIQGITSDLAQNLSQLPQVLPQVANTVFSSFSSILNLGRSVMREDDYSNTPQIPKFTEAIQPAEIPQETSDPLPSVPLFNREEYVAQNQANQVTQINQNLPTIGSDANSMATSNKFRLNMKKRKTYAPVPGLTLGEAEPISIAQIDHNPQMMHMQPLMNVQPMFNNEQSANFPVDINIPSNSEALYSFNAPMALDEHKTPLTIPSEHDNKKSTDGTTLLNPTYSLCQSIDTNSTELTSNYLYQNDINSMPPLENKAQACLINSIQLTPIVSPREITTVKNNVNNTDIFPNAHQKSFADFSSSKNEHISVNNSPMFFHNQEVASVSQNIMPIKDINILSDTKPNLEAQIYDNFTLAQNENPPLFFTNQANSNAPLKENNTYTSTYNPSMFINNQGVPIQSTPDLLNKSNEIPPLFFDPNAFNTVSKIGETTSEVNVVTNLPKPPLAPPKIDNVDNKFRMPTIKKRPKYYSGPIDGSSQSQEQIKPNFNPIVDDPFSKKMVDKISPFPERPSSSFSLDRLSSAVSFTKIQNAVSSLFNPGDEAKVDQNNAYNFAFPDNSGSSPYNAFNVPTDNSSTHNFESPINVQPNIFNANISDNFSYYDNITQDVTNQISILNVSAHNMEPKSTLDFNMTANNSIMYNFDNPSNVQEGVNVNESFSSTNTNQIPMLDVSSNTMEFTSKTISSSTSDFNESTNLKKTCQSQIIENAKVNDDSLSAIANHIPITNVSSNKEELKSNPMSFFASNLNTLTVNNPKQNFDNLMNVNEPQIVENANLSDNPSSTITNQIPLMNVSTHNIESKLNPIPFFASDLNLSSINSSVSIFDNKMNKVSPQIVQNANVNDNSSNLVQPQMIEHSNLSDNLSSENIKQIPMMNVSSFNLEPKSNPTSFFASDLRLLTLNSSVSNFDNQMNIVPPQIIQKANLNDISSNVIPPHMIEHSNLPDNPPSASIKQIPMMNVSSFNLESKTNPISFFESDLNLPSINSFTPNFDNQMNIIPPEIIQSANLNDISSNVFPPQMTERSNLRDNPPSASIKQIPMMNVLPFNLETKSNPIPFFASDLNLSTVYNMKDKSSLNQPQVIADTNVSEIPSSEVINKIPMVNVTSYSSHPMSFFASDLNLSAANSSMYNFVNQTEKLPVKDNLTADTNQISTLIASQNNSSSKYFFDALSSEPEIKTTEQSNKSVINNEIYSYEPSMNELIEEENNDRNEITFEDYVIEPSSQIEDEIKEENAAFINYSDAQVIKNDDSNYGIFKDYSNIISKIDLYNKNEVVVDHENIKKISVDDSNKIELPPFSLFTNAAKNEFGSGNYSSVSHANNMNYVGGDNLVNTSMPNEDKIYNDSFGYFPSKNENKSFFDLCVDQGVNSPLSNDFNNSPEKNIDNESEDETLRADIEVSEILSNITDKDKIEEDDLNIESIIQSCKDLIGDNLPINQNPTDDLIETQKIEEPDINAFNPSLNEDSLPIPTNELKYLNPVLRKIETIDSNIELNKPVTEEDQSAITAAINSYFEHIEIPKSNASFVKNNGEDILGVTYQSQQNADSNVQLSQIDDVNQIFLNQYSHKSVLDDLTDKDPIVSVDDITDLMKPLLIKDESVGVPSFSNYLDSFEASKGVVETKVVSNQGGETSLKKNEDDVPLFNYFSSFPSSNKQEFNF